MKKYYLIRNGKSFGPYDATHLKQLAATGKLRGDDTIRGVDKPDGKRADEIKGLMPTSTPQTLTLVASGQPPTSVDVSQPVKSPAAVSTQGNQPTAALASSLTALTSQVAGASLSAVQQAKRHAELARLQTLVLPRSWRTLGQHIWDTNPELAKTFPELADSIRAQITSLAAVGTASESPAATSFAGRALRLAGVARNLATAKVIETQLGHALSSLGRAAYERLGASAGPARLIEPVRASLDRIGALSDARTAASAPLAAKASTTEAADSHGQTPGAAQPPRLVKRLSPTRSRRRLAFTWAITTAVTIPGLIGAWKLVPPALAPTSNDQPLTTAALVASTLAAGRQGGGSAEAEPSSPAIKHIESPLFVIPYGSVSPDNRYPQTSISDDGQWICVNTWEGPHLWNATTQKEVALSDKLAAAVVSPNGRFVAGPKMTTVERTSRDVRGTTTEAFDVVSLVVLQIEGNDTRAFASKELTAVGNDRCKGVGLAWSPTSNYLVVTNHEHIISYRYRWRDNATEPAKRSWITEQEMLSAGRAVTSSPAVLIFAEIIDIQSPSSDSRFIANVPGDTVLESMNQQQVSMRGRVEFIADTDNFLLPLAGQSFRQHTLLVDALTGQAEKATDWRSAVTPNGRYCLSLAKVDGKEIWSVYEFGSMKSVADIPDIGSDVTVADIAFSDDGHEVYVSYASDTGSRRLVYGLPGGKHLRDEPYWAAGFDAQPSGERSHWDLVCFNRGPMELWDATGAAPVALLGSSGQPNRTACCSKYGDVVLSAASSSKQRIGVEVWKPNGGRPVPLTVFRKQHCEPVQEEPTRQYLSVSKDEQKQGWYVPQRNPAPPMTREVYERVKMNMDLHTVEELVGGQPHKAWQSVKSANDGKGGWLQDNIWVFVGDSPDSLVVLQFHSDGGGKDACLVDKQEKGLANRPTGKKSLESDDLPP
jgi:hypothetical protein